MKFIKSFESYAAEKEAPVKPTTKPTTKPGKERPKRPSPIRKDEPSVIPGPKAGAKKVIERVYAEMDSELKKIIINKYDKEIQ